MAILARFLILGMGVLALFGVTKAKGATDSCPLQLAARAADDARSRATQIRIQWREWITMQVRRPTAALPISDWVFALRAWRKMTAAEREELRDQIQAALEGWSSVRITELEHSAVQIHAVLSQALADLTPHVTAAVSKKSHAESAWREVEKDKPARPWAIVRWWHPASDSAYQDALANFTAREAAFAAASAEVAALLEKQKELTTLQNELVRLVLLMEKISGYAGGLDRHPLFGRRGVPERLKPRDVESLLAILLVHQAAAGSTDDVILASMENREQFRAAILRGNFQTTSLPTSVRELFAADDNAEKLQQRLVRLVKASGADPAELGKQMEAIRRNSADTGYFERLTALSSGKLAYLERLAAIVLKNNAKELGQIRQALSTMKVTRRTTRACLLEIQAKTKRATELVNQQLRIKGLQKLIFRLKQGPPRRTAAITSTSPTLTASACDDFFWYYFIYFQLLQSHGHEASALSTANHYLENPGDGLRAIEEKGLNALPAVPADPHVVPVGDDFGGAKEGDFKVGDDGMCQLGGGGDFVPAVDSGVSFSGTDTATGSYEVSTPSYDSPSTYDSSPSYDSGGSYSGGGDCGGGGW